MKNLTQSHFAKLATSHLRKPKAVHFGAGNIGRGFIGLMLVKSGYDVTFVTRNKRKISELQLRNDISQISSYRTFRKITII